MDFFTEEEEKETGSDVYVFPASFAQQRLWFLDRYLPGSTLYHMPFVVRLQGRLDVSAWEASLQEIEWRHETLRTTFELEEGQVIQVVSQQSNFQLAVIDCTELDNSHQEGRIHALLTRELEQPFDLEKGPLWRAHLLRLGEEDHLFILCMHHIISDGWSMGVFIEETATLYQTFCQGQPSPLSELPIQYVDYTMWQQELLQGATMEQQLTYWKQQLAGDLPVLQLPTDRPRPPVQTHHGAVHRFSIEKTLTDRLHAVSQRTGSTLFMTLLAAFQVLLHRYSGQEDILVGTPIAGRHRQETRELIGFFINTLVIRTDLSENPSFVDLLSRVKKTALGAYSHQDLPFEKLVEELRPDRDVSRTALFQVMFSLQNAPMGELSLPGLSITPVDFETKIAKFDLNFSLTEHSDGIDGALEFNTDLYDHATIQRMADHFKTLLASIVEQPDRSINDLPILSASERHTLLHLWDDDAIVIPVNTTLHETFERQAAHDPEKVAVIYEDRRVTYGELNAHANRLARCLQQAGVSASSKVGLCTERSIELIIGILAILKAGAAYVPLDPTHPSERLDFQVRDAEVSALLCQPHLLTRLPETGVPTVMLEESEWMNERADNLHTPVTPDNTAYMIYTSGSTGQPKGVLIPHGNVLRLLSPEQRWFSFDEQDVWTLFHSYAFDFTVWEIWGALLYGGTLVVVPYWVSRSPDDYYKLVVQERVTVLNQTPSAFRQFIQTCAEKGSPCDLSLKAVYLGGEALDLETLRPWFAQSGTEHVLIYNLYGITETTVQTTYRQITAQDVEAAVGSLIGRPLPDMKLYVLDANRQPVPFGVSGEIYVGGAGLAQGYWRRDALTAERFLPDPFAGDPAARMYRSGDLARILPSGDLEYLGRIDHQVKIRGFRIELGEITSVVSKHDQVLESIVLVYEEQSGDQSLVAYVVAEPGDALDVQDLRRHTGARLPEYMVPQWFVQIDSFPLTVNGKIDRKALPAPDPTAHRRQQTQVPLRTETEHAVAAVWQEVLGVNEIGADDHFFELGGHSLLAALVISRLEARCQVDLPLRDLFEAPTVASLAERIDRLQSSSHAPSPILPLGQTDDLPLSFGQQRLWWLHQLQPESTAYNMPFALRLQGRVHVPALEAALQEIVRRHEVLRTVFYEVDGVGVSRITPFEPHPLSVIDLTSFAKENREEKVQQRLRQAVKLPFHLATGPLVRGELLLTGEQEAVLVINMHHIASDGWSVAIFVQEIIQLYTAFVAEAPSPLPALSIQYADFAAWQQERLSGEMLEQQLQYWKDELGGELPTLQLPLDGLGVWEDTTGSTVSLSLSPELTARLRELSSRHDASLFMTLLGAFQVLLGRLSGQDDLTIGTPVAGRNRPETEGLIGLFLNTLVLRANLSADNTFVDLLHQVREKTLNAFAHAELPFEKLVEELNPARNLHQNPLFDVLINFQNQPQSALELPGLTLTPIPYEEPQAKFMLTLFIQEEESALHLRLLYRKALWSQERAQTVLRQLQTLLEQVVANPQQRIGTYSLVTAEDAKWLPDADEVLDEPVFAPVHELFLQQARQAPSHIAVQQGDCLYTYEKLADRAHVLAQTLLQKGVKKGDVVALIANRTLELIPAMLGVMQSGGVLLLIDEQLPQARQELMVQESRAAFVFRLDDLTGWSEQQMLSGASLEPPLEWPILSPNDPAYLFFTSGTTGTPKGVLGVHKGLSHFLVWQQNTFTITAQDRAAQLINLSFDPVLRDVFLPLISGATLCLPSAADDLSPDHLLPWLEHEGITLLNSVPSLVQTWLQDIATTHDLPDGITLRRLRWMFLAGEPLSGTLVERLRNRFPQVGQIVNLYGPTETTLAKCYYIVPMEVPTGLLPVGRELPNTQALLVNEQGNPCGVGEPGEVILRTPFRTLGYVNAPEVATARGIGDHSYRTGDQGRRRPDGLLELLGRVDDQVKIRGVRLHLSEVSARLLQHPDVQACAVLDWKEGEEVRLAAYAVPKDGMLPTLQELRHHLERMLPAAMVPTQYVLLEELPVTPNGKIDRRRLPKPEAIARSESVYIAPRTDVEQQVSTIWQSLLGVEKISIHDSFFDLGGHSLLAMQLTSRVRRAFGTDVALRTIFDAPTVAQFTSVLISALGTTEQETRIVPQFRPEQLPLSYAQQRLWFFERFTEGTPLYNIPLLVRVQGPLQLPLLERSLQEIIQRHETLRTTFDEQDGEAVQRISATLSLPLEVLEMEAETEAIAYLQAAAHIPFNLQTGPLMRVVVIKLDSQNHLMLINLHHIISDGWSNRVLLEEIAQLYGALGEGNPLPLAKLNVQYADYLLWQREWLAGDRILRQLDYWRVHLQDVPVLQLPTDRPRPAVQSFAGDRLSFQLGTELSNELRELSRTEGVSLFMTMLAAFQTWLSRCTSQQDIAVGSPISGRHHQELEGLIGFFANTIVLRTDLTGDPTFRQLLQRVRHITLDAYAHQDVPFERVVQEVMPERNMSVSPLFQAMFVLHNQSPNAQRAVQEITIQQVPFEGQTAKFDLTLALVEQEDGLHATFEYNTDLFDRTTVERFATLFCTLTEDLVFNPDQSVTHARWQRADESHCLLHEWNQTTTDFPRHLSVHRLFEGQVARTPDAIAAVFAGVELTYRELNARANRLARALQAAGVTPGTFVGLSLERSLELPVSLLAVLKAGGVYVPIDPDNPVQRIRFLVDDAGLCYWVTEKNCVERLPVQEEIVLLTDDPALSKWPDLNLEVEVESDQLAYVVYTSGSTGQPKGVCVPHRAIVRLVMNTNYVPFTADSVFLQFAPLAFDAATFEIWGSLLHGAKLALYPSARASLRELGRFLREESITTAFLTTALFHQMVEEQADDLSVLRHLLVGGEVLSASHVEKLLHMAPETQFLHVYGPTETTTFATCQEVRCVQAGQSVPIGRPIANTTAYVFDAHMQPVPIGIPGELYIGGDGVAVGYLGRPDLTKAAFLPHPYREGERLYKTGDLVRRLPDGTLEFIGRVDHQVKLRGFRIELGEVETAILHHPDVHATVVLLQTTPTGEKKMVAYASPRPFTQLRADVLRNSLRERLPEHMVPSAIVLLDQMPVNANGKIDRKALLALEGFSDSQSLTTTYVAPRTPDEQLIANVFADVLHVEQVGACDNFFDRGGHSLLATRAIARLNAIFEREIPLRMLFEAPTVSELAARLRDDSYPNALRPMLQRRGDQGPQPLSFAQQRLWVVNHLLQDTSVYNIPFAVRLSGTLNVEALERSLQAILSRHDSLRTTFQEVQGQAVQIITPPQDVKLPLYDLQNLPETIREQELLEMAKRDRETPFDLARDFLLRFQLLRMATEEHVLLLNFHHIIADGWSIGVFTSELAALYRAFAEGEPSPLPELPIQYTDFAAWQHEWLSGEVFTNQFDYWKKQLGGELPTLRLPTDRPRPAVQTQRGAVARLHLNRELADSLQALSRRHGVTLFMTLLAAYQTLLGRWSGQEDLCIGTPIAGRTAAETEGLIGFFLNTLVLRTDLSGQPTFIELLSRVREVTLGGYAHQDIPFEKLVQELQPERDLTRSPLFQAMFILQNTPMEDVTLPGLTMRPFQTDAQLAKFDLSLSLTEGEEGLTGGLTYNADLYDATTMQQFLQQFETLLRAVVDDATQRISELPLLGEGDREWMLSLAHGAVQEQREQLCLHQLFEQQAAKTPEAVAVYVQGQTVTYDDLNRRANRIAHALRKRQVGPNVLVGLRLVRSVEWIAATLGVLKSGGAFVPLDPSYPADRLAYMVQDSNPHLILTAEVLETWVAEREADDWQNEQNLVLLNQPNDLAYITYTSGSTGRPKGVQSLHRGAVNYLQYVLTTYELSKHDRVLQLASPSFDASVRDMMGPLCAGASVVLVSTETILNPSALLDEMSRSGATCLLSIVPTLLQALNKVALETPAVAPALRLILVSGEVLYGAVVRHTHRAFGSQVLVVNQYGPTECTMTTTYHPITEQEATMWPTMRAGRPIPNARVYVLDSRFELVPPNVVGEVYIGGVGVTRGYLNQPELTAQAFLPDPFTTDNESRLYRTGDLGRLLADGTLEFVGRADQQVKIRGQRVELGEIQALLLEHPDVRDAVVLAESGSDGQAHLVAYVVSSEQASDAGEWRRYLRTKLPEGLVPTAYIPLATLPKTPNGKLDRRALPAWEQAVQASAPAYTAPRTPFEEIVADIWQDVLGRDQIGVHDNFWALGGHSLLAIQVVSRIQEALDIRLPLAELFEKTTVEELAQLIEDILFSDLEEVRADDTPS